MAVTLDGTDAADRAGGTDGADGRGGASAGAMVPGKDLLLRGLFDSARASARERFETEAEFLLQAPSIGLDGLKDLAQAPPSSIPRGCFETLSQDDVEEHIRRLDPRAPAPTQVFVLHSTDGRALRAEEAESFGKMLESFARRDFDLSGASNCCRDN